MPIFPCGLAAWSYFNDTFDLSRASSGCVFHLRAHLRSVFAHLRPICAHFRAPLLLSPRSIGLAVSATGLAFKTDLNKRFASKTSPAHFNDAPGLAGGATLAAPTLAADERFIAWMRTPALSDFRKLWGRIDNVVIAEGETIRVDINNLWNSYAFGGKKRIVLSTSTWLGGANDFLGVAYIVVGCICMALAVGFAALVAARGRALADPKFYSWNQPAKAE